MLAAAVALAACSGDHAATGRRTAAACDRACLERLIDAVMNAMVAHDASKLPLTSGFRYVENNVVLKPGLGSWRTVQSFGPYRHYFADPESGNAAIISTLRENDADGLFTLRIRTAGGRLVEAEAIFTHDPRGAANYARLGKPADSWLETVPEDERMSREELAETANKYYGAMENNDGKGDYSFFADDCNRLEHGARTTNTTRQKYGHSTDTEFVMLGCRGQFETGFLGFVTRIRDRRFEVIDVERGAVFSIAGFDHDGRSRNIPLTTDKVFKVPSYFSAGRTLQVAEGFRMRDGRIKDIETTLHEFPYGMPTGFHSTYDPSNEVPGGAAPDLLQKCDAVCLESMADRLLAAMVAHDPTRAPLAETLRYTENDQRLELYDGLWGTLTRVGTLRLRVVEPTQGAISVIASTVETDLRGVLVVRLRVRGDRITEIEAHVTREERAGAEELFRAHPPVELDPAGFAVFDPEFASPLPTEQRRERLQLVALADRYFDAVQHGIGGAVAFTPDCSRRENGVVVTSDCAGQLQSGYSAYVERIRDRRMVAVDVERGLVAATTYYDIPGTIKATIDATGAVTLLPGASGRPYTLAALHVFRFIGSDIERIETVDKVLPYGARPAWRAR